MASIQIERISGIVNGTTNFILSEMAATGASYDDVLARAQELGYAEADPTDDVNGADAAAKMAILARLAFHTPVGLEDVSFEGISEISPDDLAYAKELGLSLKLLGVAEQHGERDQRPRLPLLPLPRPSARAGRGTVQRGHARGRRRSARSRCRGPAPAGSRRPPPSSPTSLDPLRRGAGALRRATGSRSSTTSSPPSTSTSRSPTEPGVLAAIADVLGRNGISVKSVVQRGSGTRGEPRDGHPPGPRARLLRGARADLRPRLPRRRRRGRSGSIERGVLGERELIERYRERLPIGPDDPIVTLDEGVDAAAPGAGALRARRRPRLPEGRGRQPDRLVQGPGDDGRRLAGRSPTAPRR